MPEMIVIKKAKIPRALKERVWIKHSKRMFQVKCPIEWCKKKSFVSTNISAISYQKVKVDLPTLKTINHDCHTD